MGLAFKPNIDDLRELPAKYLTTRIISEARADVLVVETNISTHKSFNVSDYRKAFEKADIVVFLVAYKEFKLLPKNQENYIGFFSIINEYN